ncbi:unnamed protein product [Nesidiocoris tenuis]|uniref:Uncharacterized protein n=1 Tax=Nesidiocoris tenuis TaxID=355587 RepID=A0A6H5GGP9_9HEMI|nr:unnamed protein product [Nesidiocoris tenuis]
MAIQNQIPTSRLLASRICWNRASSTCVSRFCHGRPKNWHTDVWNALQMRYLLIKYRFNSCSPRLGTGRAAEPAVRHPFLQRPPPLSLARSGQRGRDGPPARHAAAPLRRPRSDRRLPRPLQRGLRLRVDGGRFETCDRVGRPFCRSVGHQRHVHAAGPHGRPSGQRQVGRLQAVGAQYFRDRRARRGRHPVGYSVQADPHVCVRRGELQIRENRQNHQIRSFEEPRAQSASERAAKRVQRCVQE